MSKTIFFFLALLFLPIAYAQLPPEYPKPSFGNDYVCVFVLFRFGAWDRVAYNNSVLTPPVYVYVYSKIGRVSVSALEYNVTGSASWGLALNLTKLEYNKPLTIVVKYGNETIVLRFKVLRSLEEKPAGPAAVFTWDQLREWLDKEAQYAGFLAMTGIFTAYVVKKKTLLIRPWNALNILILFVVSLAIVEVAKYTGHSQYLALPFALSEFITYGILRIGSKISLFKIVPSAKKIIREEGVFYRTPEGLLAFARQSITEAINRLRGRHIIVKDAGLDKIGEIPSDRFWRYEDITEYETTDALLLIDAVMRNEVRV